MYFKVDINSDLYTSLLAIYTRAELARKAALDLAKSYGFKSVEGKPENYAGGAFYFIGNGKDSNARLFQRARGGWWPRKVNIQNGRPAKSVDHDLLKIEQQIGDLPEVTLDEVRDTIQFRSQESIIGPLPLPLIHRAGDNFLLFTPPGVVPPAAAGLIEILGSEFEAIARQ